MSPRISKKIGFLLTAGVVPLVAYSQVYLTEEQALEQIFPGEKFTRKTIELKPEDVKKIEDASGERVRGTSVIAWVGSKKSTVIIDQALGKHEFITYAVGISRDAKVKDIEILEYRETYGYQVKEAGWRSQFAGKTVSDPLKVGKDIVNISGATLSSTHITGGVRRLLQTYASIRERL